MMLQDNSRLTQSGLRGNTAYSHAYIISGGYADDRQSQANQLASAMLCEGTGERPCTACVHCRKAQRHIHPDIIYIDKPPDGKEILVDQIRSLREDAVVMPNEAAKKVYIIRHADDMNTSAQNAILKLLEEPPESAAFILDAANAARLLPTVRSRCVEIAAVNTFSEQVSQTRETTTAFFEAVAGGPLMLIEFSYILEKMEKSEFPTFINDVKASVVSRLKEGQHDNRNGWTPAALMQILDLMNRAQEYYDQNVSMGHIAGMICATLIQPA